MGKRDRDSSGGEGYMLDRQLVPRVREWLATSGKSPLVASAAAVAADLQAQHVDYRRKKRAAFQRSVDTALKILQRAEETAQGQPPLVRLDDEVSSDASLSDERAHHRPPTSAVNDSLTAMYRAANGAPAQPPNGDTIAIDRGTPAAAGPKAKKARLEKGGGGEHRPPGNPFRKGVEAVGPEFAAVEAQRKLCDMGGCEEAKTAVCRGALGLRHPEIYRGLGLRPPTGLLLHGPPGSGKSLLAEAVAGELGLAFFRVPATQLVSGISGDSEERMRRLFRAAEAAAPAVLFLDEIDVVSAKRETAQREMERRMVAQLIACLDGLNRTPSTADGEAEEEEARGNVLVIGATCRPDSLDPALRRAGRFDSEIGLGIPDQKARAAILAVLTKTLRMEPGLDLARVAALTPGFVGADLSAVVREASLKAVNRAFQLLSSTEALTGEEAAPVPSDPKEAELEKVLGWLRREKGLSGAALEGLRVTSGDMAAAVRQTQPSAKREGFATVPDVSWAEVGALAGVREELSWAILYPVREAAAFEAAGLGSRAEGVLLAGPPGCGKTLLAKAVANESGLNFISVKGPELLSMYVGESERAVRTVFQRARNSAPCVVFFDELDALCPRRRDGDSGGSARVVNQLLTEMDGMEARSQVFLMAATNRPDIIDPAVLRPGRLDKTVFVGFPSAEDRVDILRALTRGGTRPRLASLALLEEVGRDARLEHYTGADLSAVVREAATAALKERLLRKAAAEQGPPDSASAAEQSLPALVAREHFDAALAKVQPSVSPSQRQHYLRLQETLTKKTPS